MPDETFELMEAIPNDVLRLDHLPPPDADGTEVWRLADTFNGFKHWGCSTVQEIANQKPDSNLTELRTCLFFECRRWHYYGELPDRTTRHISGGWWRRSERWSPPVGSNDTGPWNLCSINQS